MDKILITNIGNRSLIYNNPEKLEQIAVKEFRTKTKQILEEVNADENELELYRVNILDALLDSEKGITHIYLFVSDQQGVHIKEQDRLKDTLFAGEIIKQLISKQYSIPLNNINVISLHCSVISPNELLPLFRKNLKNILAHHSNSELIIGDAGGTPQQETSLKIAAEYLLPKDTTIYYQIAEILDEKGDIKLGYSNAIKQNKENSQAYKKIIDEQQIALLVDNGNYGAAVAIRKTSEKDLIYKVLLFNNFRLSNLPETAKNEVFFSENEQKDITKYIDRFIKSNNNKPYKTVVDFLSERPLGNYDVWKNELRAKDFFALCEILSIADFYWYHTKNYTNALLTYHIFIEKFTQSVISKKTSYDLINRYYAVKGNFLDTEIKNRGTDIETDLGFLPTSLSLPVLISYVKHFQSTNLIVADIIQTFYRCHNTLSKNGGINLLRDDIAHNGKGIKDVQMIYNQTPDFGIYIKKWREYFGLGDTENNIYLQANKEIKEALKMND